MATLSTLRTALTTRLGLSTLTTPETNRLDEALNGAVARIYGDGFPSLAESYVGSVQGDLSTTITAHSAGTSVVSLASTAGVFPQDILVVGATKYLVGSVSGLDIDLGIPVAGTLSGSVTVTRRALELPHEGTVTQVRVVEGRTLDPLTNADVMAPFDTASEPSHFMQRWSSDQDKSYVALYPAPSTTTQVVLKQYRANAEDADIDVPYTALEPILNMAHILYLGWSVSLSQAGLVLRDQAQTADLKHQSTDDGVRTR
jgi:hypothetical protein